MADGFDDVYVATRRQLRGVAESLIAGPQYRVSGTIRLAVRPGGFAGVALPISVHGRDLVWLGGGAPLAGPVGAIADAAGVDAGPPDGVYDLVDPLPADAVLDLDVGSHRVDTPQPLRRAATRSNRFCPNAIRCCGRSISTSRPPRTK